MRIRQFGFLLTLVLLIGGLVFASLALADAPPRTTDWSSNPPTAASLVVGVPNEGAGSLDSAGIIQNIYGYASSGLGYNSEYFGQTASSGVVEANDMFGSAVAVADFNRDGYFDIAVGVPGEGNDTGAVNILYGAASGFTGRDYIGYDAIGAAGDKFGAALATGDLNGDGTPDLAVGAPGYDFPNGESSIYTDTGAVYIFWGAANGSGLITSTTSTYYSDDRNSYGQYGSALAAADFNGDGHDELVIGSPNHSTPAPISTPTRGGTIYILTPFNGNQTEWNQTSASNDGAEEGDKFGASLAVGDFNGDGYPDLAIGAPGEDTGTNPPRNNAGAVSVMYNDGSGLSATGSQFWMQDNIGFNSEAGDEFGSSLASGDFDNNGFDDLAIGTPYEDFIVGTTNYDNIGLVQLVSGSTTGLTTDYMTIDIDTIMDNPGDNQYRGAAIAVGDFDSDGKDDIAVGIPGYTVSGNTSAGAIKVSSQIDWSATGASYSNYGPVTQSDLSSAGTSSEAYDHFGDVLAVLPAPLTHRVYLPLVLR